jgi:hypothetical protein
MIRLSAFATCGANTQPKHQFARPVSSTVDPIGAARALWTKTHPLRSFAEVPNPDQSTASRAANSDSTSVPRLPNRTRNRKTKPIIVAGAQ